MALLEYLILTISLFVLVPNPEHHKFTKITSQEEKTDSLDQLFKEV
jgi:hypothetical protein